MFSFPDSIILGMQSTYFVTMCHMSFEGQFDVVWMDTTVCMFLETHDVSEGKGVKGPPVSFWDFVG